MASSITKGSLRRPSNTNAYYTKEGKPITSMRPGKTAEDKRIGAWMPKSERNSRQAGYQAQHAHVNRKK